MRHCQFSLRALLVLMLATACFFGGIWVERERQRRADEAASLAAASEEEQRKHDRFMARFAGLMDEERYRKAESLADLVEPIAEPRRPLILPALPSFGDVPSTEDFPNWPAPKR